MTIINYGGSVELHADEGKILTNGDEYAEIVYLSDNDDISNWEERDMLNDN